jgi:hypothetical protein
LGDLRESDHLQNLGTCGDDTIKMDLQEQGCGGRDWIYLTQDRNRALVNAVINLAVPLYAGTYLTCYLLRMDSTL